MPARPTSSTSLLLRPALALAALLVSTGACASAGGSASTTAGGATTGSAARVSRVERTASLSPYGSYGLNGTVTATADDDEAGPATVVRVQGFGAPENSILRWHIHQGACGANGAVFGNAGGYSTLSSDGNGGVRTSIRLRESLPAAEVMSVDVHGESGSTEVIACGNLKPAR